MKLRDAREQAGFTQEGLAREANISLASARKLERDRAVDPAFRTVMTICRVLGQPWEQIDEFSRLVRERV